MSDAPQCPKCDLLMEVGSVLGGASVGLRKWISGETHRFKIGPLQLGIGGYTREQYRRMLDIVMYRCPSCGYLESYAPALSPEA